MIYTKRRQAESKDENINKDINKKHQIFLDKAAEIAKYSTMQQKHGAVIVHKNKIIAYGFNYMTHYLNDNNSIHAEVAAISQVFKNKTILEDCDIYVVRIAPPTNPRIAMSAKKARYQVGSKAVSAPIGSIAIASLNLGSLPESAAP